MRGVRDQPLYLYCTHETRMEPITIEPYKPDEMQAVLKEVERYDPEDVMRALSDYKRRGM